LADRLPEIEHYVSEAQWVTKAGIVGRRFQAVFKSLTDASKSASERLLNQNFEKRFRRECERLRAPHVKLFFPGRQGQVTRHKSVVADHRLSEILSEGEQKVIALADFLAEVGLKSHAPVIFDDPVNSLDYRRMDELVGRLVELSRERQVIVFTHNIWFTMELLSRFDKTSTDCSYYDVRSDGPRFGIVSKGTHPRSDTYKNLRGKLNALIQSAAKETGETQMALIEKCYEYLRSICEVLVEVELLQGVTQRYQPETKTHEDAEDPGFVPIIQPLRLLLDAIKPENASGWMFPNTIGGALDLENLADRVIKPVFKANGLEWKGWHAYRRGLATNLHELGVPDKVIQAILRHEDVSTTQRSYIKTVPQVVTDAMNQLEARIARAAVVQQVAVN
jgi:integrase